MLLTDEQARTRECILLVQQGMQGMVRPKMGKRIEDRLTESNCYGSSCVAYWRWFNPEKTLGYCSLGGKPEF